MAGVGHMGCGSGKDPLMSWPTALLVPLALIYFSVLSMLSMYGVNFLYLAFSAWRFRGIRRPQPAPVLSEYPLVTVQLPIYNEWFVAARIIEAAAALDYPADRLEIQVLDDSTDETAAIVAETVAQLRRKGLAIHHLHRSQRDGYKAGALRDGLLVARGEYVAIFDSDFLPPRDFLRQVLPSFSSEEVAFVQGRWGHLNRGCSLFTLLQSLSIDAHFPGEQFARAGLGYAFNFNGTAGVWRAAAIRDAGGWKADTLTEDLDLSYRAFLRGWSARYTAELEVPAELPLTFAAYRRQQHRWARGSLECAMRYLPLVWRSNRSSKWKIQASLHLTGYGIHLLMLALSFLLPAVLMVSIHYRAVIDLFGIAAFFNLTGLAPTILFAAAQSNLGRKWWQYLPAIFLTSILGAGMMLNTLHAAIEALRRHRAIFERTPKYGIIRPDQTWDIARYRVIVHGLLWPELALAAFNLWTVRLAAGRHDWFIVFYAGLFAAGLISTATLAVIQSLPLKPRRQAQQADAARIPA